MARKQKKVLFVATVASHIKSFHLPYLKMFQEKGFKVFVAANWNIIGQDKLNYCDKFIHIPIRRSPYSFKNIKAINELKKLINDEQFDIIHCHTPMGAVVARLAARKARKKYGTRVIYTAHGFHFYNGAPKKNWILFYPVEWYLAKFTDTLITINQEDFKRAKEKFGKRCKDIKYVPGVGINIKKLDSSITREKRRMLRKSLKLNEEDFVLIFPARLDKNKNQGFLIDTMSILINKKLNIHLLLPGRDEMNGYYKRITKEKGLDKYIHFLGKRNDVPELMQISDVAVSSSLREGLPVNVMEAFAAGKPVIALSCRGVSDLIENGKNGYIVDSVSEMTDKIMSLKDEKIVVQKIINNNKAKVKKYSLESISDEMKRIYF